MNAIDKPKSPWLSVGGIAGAIVGFYCGLMLVIPLVISFAAAALFKKMETPKVQHFQFAAAVIIGHMAWMSMGFFVKNVSAVSIVPDLILMAIGLVWLLTKPGRGVVWYLTLVEGITAVINVINLLPESFGSLPHKALIAHICLRLFVISSLWLGLRVKTTPPPLPTAPPLAEV